MPRKQRFKPSRKPKSPEVPQDQPPPSETGNIESGTPPRGDDDRSVNEHADEIS